MNIVSFTLYGTSNRYLDPILINSEIFSEIYPNWKMRVFHDNSVPAEVLSVLSCNQVELINVTKKNSRKIAPKFWRFLPIFDTNVQNLIIRDADSLISTRESQLVDEWINSEYDFHIIRDHPLHLSPILAGMFGIKMKSSKIFSEFFLAKKKLISSTKYGADQIFLSDYIYPRIKHNSLIHTSSFAIFGEKFKKIDKSKDSNFIGAILKPSTQEYVFPPYLSQNFIIGIPFWLHRLIRYKTRPVLYLSILQHKLVTFYSNISRILLINQP